MRSTLPGNYVKQSASDSNRDAAREAVGKAIIVLASAGDLNTTHLTNYAAYQARQFIDLPGRYSSAPCGDLGASRLTGPDVPRSPFQRRLHPSAVR